MSILLSLNSVCPGDHTLEGNAEDIATNPGLCFGHLNLVEVMNKTKGHQQNCFSDGTLINK